MGLSVLYRIYETPDNVKKKKKGHRYDAKFYALPTDDDKKM